MSDDRHLLCMSEFCKWRPVGGNAAAFSWRWCWTSGISSLHDDEKLNRPRECECGCEFECECDFFPPIGGIIQQVGCTTQGPAVSSEIGRG